MSAHANRRMLARRALVMLVPILATVLAGCGVRSQDDPVRVSDADVSYRLLQRSVPTSRPAGIVQITVFFVGADRLVPVGLSVNDPSANTALEALLRGPSETEAAQGLTTALPSPDTVRLSGIVSRVANVALSAEFLDGSVPDQSAALAQIVYTLTARGGITGVQFTLAGKPTAVPRADGSLTAAPVGRTDYEALAPSG